MGRNGAGKSTTIKALMGLIAQRAGTVSFLGEDISELKPFEIARRGLGFVPEDRRIFSDLTVLENLDIGRQPARHLPDGRPAPSWTPEKLFTIFPNLGGMPDRRGAPYERRRAADADGRAHADGQSAAGAARRAVRRRRAGHRRADGQHHRRTQEGRPVGPAVRAEHPFRRTRVATAPMCWRRASCSGTAPWPSSPPTSRPSAACCRCSHEASRAPIRRQIRAIGSTIRSASCCGSRCSGIRRSSCRGSSRA